MRIVDWPTFSQMPEGTFFLESCGVERTYPNGATFEGFSASRLQVKSETIFIDGLPRGYWAAFLADWDCNEFDIYKPGDSAPMDLSASKSIPVEDGTLFCVLEVADLLQIREVVDEGIVLTSPPGDVGE